jgi:hypothetical protein
MKPSLSKSLERRVGAQHDVPGNATDAQDELRLNQGNLP